MSGTSFTKCKKCNVNIPVTNPPEFCPVCNTKIDITSNAKTTSYGNAKIIEENKPKLKRRWVELENSRGKIYYHNSDTGEDRWTKPSDFDALVMPSTVLPAENTMKKAVLNA